MHYRNICKTFSIYLWILVIPLCIPLFIAFYCEFVAEKDAYPQPPSFFAFFVTICITLFFGALLRIIGRVSSGMLYRKEALLVVIAVYLITPLIGALPFYVNGTLKNPADAYFEAVSGLTTTGASVLIPKKYESRSEKEFPIHKTIMLGAEKTAYTYWGTIPRVFNPQTNRFLEGLDAVSPALIFWRSFMTWMGGGGIIVLFVAILPALGMGGKVLFQTEVTGPVKDATLPRIKETASQVWKIYLGLTILQIFLLIITNKKMSLFDAVSLSFSTLSTGGFSPINGGLETYKNAYTDWIITIFMLLGSINFSLFFFFIRGKFSRLNDPELKTFLSIILISVAIAVWQLWGYREPSSGKEYHFWEALRYGTFQVVSFQTTTGFATANYDIWPFPIQVMLLILMFIGGMAGSTAGGLKVIRQQIFFRIMLNKIESIYRPETVRSYRIGLTQIDHTGATTILCFFMVAISLLVIGTFLLVLDGVDPETSLTTIASMLNNSGCAFRMAGPEESFAFLSCFGKILSCLWMIAGRLEYFAVLIIFVPSFWRST